MDEKYSKLAAELMRMRARNSVLFWGSVGGWPSDTPNYVFLANAVHRVGEVLFQNVWTGEEPTDWAAQIISAPANRMSLVIRTIVSNAVIGRLTFANRPTDVLAFSPMSWGSQNNHQRFLQCRVSRVLQKNLTLANLALDPFEYLRSDLSKRHVARDLIFITRSSLDEYLRSIAPGADPNLAVPGPSTMGAKPKYDWPSFQTEARRILEYRGAFNPAFEVSWNQAALERYMAEWCADRWKTEPAESVIRNQVSRALASFLKAREAGN